MRRLCTWLGRRRWFVSVPLVIVAGIVAYLLIHSLLSWANSTRFCGETCHVMDPEYTAYQQSFHARVACVECHVGPGLWAEVEAKWEGLRELYLNVTKTFERPIASPVENLRPARETCEQCHWPEVFYEDRAVELVHYAEDEENTRTNTYMLVKIGGGTSRRGQGRGIHWHIENLIEYVALDPQRQEIPWVRAQIDGETITYVDAGSSFDETALDQYEVRVMDCIDCHNRATHIFRSAEQAVTEAMANRLLPTDLPYLYKQAVETMGATYASEEDALAAIATIPDYYRENYPEVYQRRLADLQVVVHTLQDLYSLSHFPEMEVYPETYPDNVGHSESPGCFRCHDGNHLSEDGLSIRLHCNICHTIPQTVAAGQPAPEVAFPGAREPASHLASDWMAEHHNAIDEGCTACHEMQTFCANVNCHGRTWPYVDLSAAEPPFPLAASADEGAATPPLLKTIGDVAAARIAGAISQIAPGLQGTGETSSRSAAPSVAGLGPVDGAAPVTAAAATGAEAGAPAGPAQGEQLPLLSPEETAQLVGWILASAPGR